MKFSEFKKEIQNHGFSIAIENTTIIVKHGVLRLLTIANDKMYAIDSKSNYFTTLDNDEKAKIMKAVIEYISTPIEERKDEETLFYLSLPDAFLKNYLNFNTFDNYYTFDNRNEIFPFKTRFTQKEIDDMPFDIKFFRKIKVEDFK